MFFRGISRGITKKWLALGLAGFLLVGLMVLVGCEGGSGSGGGNSQQATRSSRDALGVWFITNNPNYVPPAGTNGAEPDTVMAEAGLYDVFKTMGYLIAEDRLWQMETYRRTARGSMAAVFGSSYLNADIAIRTVGYSDDEIQAAFDGMDQEIKDVINGYVDGINQRLAVVLADGAALLPFEFKAAGFTPAPWTIIDVLAWVVTLQRNFDPEGIGCLSNPVQLNNMALYTYLSTVYGTDGPGMFGDLRWVNDSTALTYIPETGPLASSFVQEATPDFQPTIDYETIRKLIEQVKAKGTSVEESIKKINAKVKMGSYAWTVAGSKTASGNPIIYSGPQMGFEVPSIVTEGSILAGGLEVSGMTVPAFRASSSAEPHTMPGPCRSGTLIRWIFISKPRPI